MVTAVSVDEFYKYVSPQTYIMEKYCIIVFIYILKHANNIVYFWNVLKETWEM